MARKKIALIGAGMIGVAAWIDRNADDGANSAARKFHGAVEHDLEVQVGSGLL